MDQEQKKKMLSQSTYEGLCRKACANPAAPNRDETVEDAYWRGIYKEVVHYLFPGSPPYFQQMEKVTLKYKYQFHLARLVNENKRGTFDPIEIATKFINEAIGEEQD
jgi:hypothetical protein